MGLGYLGGSPVVVQDLKVKEISGEFRARSEQECLMA